MSLIDTRLAQIQDLRKKCTELEHSPNEAIRMSRQIEALQKSLGRDMGPLKALMDQTTIFSS